MFALDCDFWAAKERCAAEPPRRNFWEKLRGALREISNFRAVNPLLVMQRYLNQLLADLETATRHAPEASSYRFVSRFRDDDDDDFGSVLRAQLVRLTDLFGLAPDVFPPVERLTKAQVASLLTAIENLWQAWRISWECPPRLTARRRYAIMVERMTTETVPYSYDLGAEINFCDHRAEGQCPFSDPELCWCKALDEAALHREFDMDELDASDKAEESPSEALNRWLRGDEDFAPWDYDEDRARWQQFVAEEDMMAWLYFYQPQRAEDAGEEPEPSPEDFEDFEWGNPYDDDFDLPF